MTITASIVIYNEDINILSKAIRSFLEIPFKKKLFLIDNSRNRIPSKIFEDKDELEYIFLGKNIGFGAAHNKILSKIKFHSDFHLILNPDVFFEKEVIVKLVEVIKNDNSLALIAPKVLFPFNDKHQYSCRKYPTIIELLVRKFAILQKMFPNILIKSEYRNCNLEKPFNPDFVHGNFMLFRTQDFVEVNGFDERYFMYMEDVDICRKIDLINKKKLYYPKVFIYHSLRRHSSHQIRLFLHHLLSVFRYFYKWKMAFLI